MAGFPENEQPKQQLSPRGAAPKDINEAVYAALRLRGWVPAVAEEETARLVEFYGQRDWRSANGYDVQDVAEAAKLWKRKPAPRGTRVPASRPQAQVYQSKPKPVFPDDWQPQVYVGLDYLAQQDYMAHLERLGWARVRPPAGTPPLVDRWYVCPVPTIA